VFSPASRNREWLAQFGVPLDATVVVNPRHLHTFVRHDLFFEAIPIVHQTHPEVWFIGIAMAGKAMPESYIAKLKLQNTVLLPPLTRTEIAAALASSEVVVSLGVHDGTPNTVIEAMSSGAFPIALDITSLREWITNKENGLLVATQEPTAVAKAIVQVLEDTALFEDARKENFRRAETWSREKAFVEMRRLYEYLLALRSASDVA
jgi:glycosyltransferase involved in cell wall biosynthesis